MALTSLKANMNSTAIRKCFGLRGAIDKSKGISAKPANGSVPYDPALDRNTPERGSRFSLEEDQEIQRKAEEGCSFVGGAKFANYSRFTRFRRKMWRYFNPSGMAVFMERYGVTHFRANKYWDDGKNYLSPIQYGLGRCYAEYREDKRVLLYPDKCHRKLPYLCERRKLVRRCVLEFVAKACSSD